MADALVIDVEGFDRLPCSANVDPNTGNKTLKKTIREDGIRDMTYLRLLPPMQFGESHSQSLDSAPHPLEIALATLGSCISVDMLVNATNRGVRLTKIEVEMEGDIDICAVSGVGDIPDRKVPGFTALRCTVKLAGDSDDETLRLIHENVIHWSPLVNACRRPAGVDATLIIDSTRV